MKRLLKLVLVAALVGTPLLGFAQDAKPDPAAVAALTNADLDGLKASITSAHGAGDTAWMLTSAALVLLMTVPGLALFYGGMVRRKNILSTMYYSMASAVVVSIVWVVAQYSMAFSAKEIIPGILGDFSKLFLNGVTRDSTWYLIPENVFSMFQLMFAIITVALISGAVVERMSITAWILFSALWSLVVYAPLAHMVWGGGWLSVFDSQSSIGALFGVPKSNTLDFAGGLVVHISSGVSALVLALLLGPRVRYGKDSIIPNNIGFTFIGAGMLWVGWFGFNAGSAVAANGLAGSAFLVTNTAAAMAALTWIVIEYIHHKKPTLIGASTGVVAGLVAITPASGFVDVTGALVIGIAVSIVCYVFVAFIKKALKYDDSLDAFGIHAVGGTTGALLTGVFANPAIGYYFDGVTPAAGGLYGNWTQLGMQALSILIAIAFAVIGTLVCYFIVSLVTKVRVEPQEEVIGLDLTQHGEKQGDR
ncbi:MAG: ammonium transporter [Spirochaetales bacterium]